MLDSKKLSLDLASKLDLTKIFDEKLLFLSNEVRPQCVQLPQKLSLGASRANWTNIEDQFFDRFAHESSDSYWTVVGEISRIQILDWGVPSETRASFIATHTSSRPTRNAWISHFFPARATWQADAYPKVAGTPIYDCAVIYGYEYRLTFSNREWLAINPWIANALGWVPHPELPFSWLQNGKIVAKSICWTDGPYNRQPPGGDVCSQGWLVVVIKSAMPDLLRVLGRSTRVQQLKRTYSEDKELSEVYELREVAV